MRYMIAVLAFLLPGCGATNFSVVRVVRSDAQAGSFTVIPSGTSDKEINFAGVAEKTFMNLGIRVVERPPFKLLPPGTPKPGDSESGENNSLHEATADHGETPTTVRLPSVVDVVTMYDDTKADYIAVTYAELPKIFRRIRVIKRSDRSVVASIDYAFDHDEEKGYTDPSAVYSGLLAAGILKGKGEVLTCDYGTPPKSAKK